jgi:hypothetical protein
MSLPGGHIGGHRKSHFCLSLSIDLLVFIQSLDLRGFFTDVAANQTVALAL